MGKRFCVHAGSLNNLSQLASAGVTEAGLVVNWDGSSTYGNIASAIHSAGIPTATLNLFNDGSSPPSQLGAAGSSYAGYFQSCVSAGWNCIAGEGCGGSVIGTVMNYCTYVNYGGIVGSSQANMYADPWDHPTSGGHGHWDYIETYDNSSNLQLDSCVQAAAQAKSAGAGHLGILIGTWMQGAGASTYINTLNQIGGDSVLMWGGYSSSSSDGFGLIQQMISSLGASKDGKGTATTSGSTAAAKVVPEVQCPCKHMWIGISGVGKDSTTTSQHLEFEVKIVGTAGWVDNNMRWIPNKPYTGKLEAWAGNATKGSWKLKDIWPDKKGNFSFLVNSDRVEKRTYAVKFA